MLNVFIKGAKAKEERGERRRKSLNFNPHTHMYPRTHAYAHGCVPVYPRACGQSLTQSGSHTDTHKKNKTKEISARNCFLQN